MRQCRLQTTKPPVAQSAQCIPQADHPQGAQHLIPRLFHARFWVLVSRSRVFKIEAARLAHAHAFAVPGREPEVARGCAHVHARRAQAQRLRHAARQRRALVRRNLQKSG